MTTKLSSLLALLAFLLGLGRADAGQLKPVDNLKTPSNDLVAGWSLADNWRIDLSGQPLSANTRYLNGALQLSQARFTATLPPDSDPSLGVMWVVDGPGPFVWTNSPVSQQANVAICTVSGLPPFGSSINGCSFWVTAYTVNYNSKLITNYFSRGFWFECLPTDFTAPVQAVGNPTVGSYTVQFSIPDAKTNLQGLPPTSMPLALQFDKPPRTRNPQNADIVDFTLSGSGIQIPFATSSPVNDGGVEYRLSINVGTTVRGYQLFWDVTQIAVSGVTNGAKLVSAKLTVP